MDQSSNDGIERRKFFRLDMEKELIDISWTDATGQVQQKKIACLDFSRGGLRLDCDQAIPLTTQVTVIFKAASANNQTLSGKVLRCVKQDSGWFEIALILDDAK
ncbi:PilZ domain-containing protein [Litorilituus lipolyticus]|uniref:PilZ domain-containing protein n=1 Tax=Litorilituus lipolyticus TaxID=2491017 RepID=A0A502KNY4_9GAMM|nr:PilZ domain-containing protein [Litorilituus lipolyticus]TPH13348.1 PilZ domain-containing protein [Litorilituus lipolyticus]